MQTITQRIRRFFAGGGLARGIAMIVATVFAMALADAVVKYASVGMTLWQIWVLRAVVVIPIFAGLGRGRWVPCPLGWVLMRSAALVFMYLGIYAALPLLDLSVIAAALYTAPLFITLLSALVLRTPCTGRQWLAVGLGFVGVLLIIRPAAAGFEPLALIPVGAACLYALAAVITRARCADVPAQTMALWLNLALLVGGTVASLFLRGADGDLARQWPFLFSGWQPMSVRNLQVIGVLSVLMVGIGIGLARAYQSDRPDVIATFDYSFLIFAVLWGYVFFGEVPDGPTIAGMILIAGAGPLSLPRAGS